MLVAWVAFPLALGLLSLGCGQAVQAVAGGRIRGTLLLPTGFAAIVVIAQLATMSARTAQLATPAVVTVAVAGGLLSLPWRPPETFRWPGLAALGTLAAFGAPVVLSGSATFTGWIKLDDGATWLAFTDRVMEHGRSLAGLPPSTYQVTLGLLDTGYPVGAFVPLGVGGQLLQQDIAWLVAPYHAFLAAMLALALYSLSSGLVQSGPLRALSAFVAAQSSTFFGYALWGGMKEVVAAAMIALVAALVPMLLAPEAPPRAAIPFGVATAATVGALSLGGAVWLAPILIPALWLILRARGVRFTGAAVAWFAGAAALMAIPTLAIARAFQPATTSLTGGEDLGNLFGPLKFEQVLGIWPAGDFRVAPRDTGPTYLLLAIAVLAAATAVLFAFRRRRPELVLYLASGLAGAAFLTQIGSPWVGGKALATASPALVAAAMVGASALFESRFQPVGMVALLAVAGGVIWSNVLQVHDVDLAPRAELADLSAIGTRFAGQGPALMTEYSPYGARHFLRELDAESASELRWNLIPLWNGTGLNKGASADIDEFQTQAVLYYRTLVLRRSATASRPPSVYRRIWQGDRYEVWQRPVVSPERILEHLRLGTPLDPGAVPRCADVKRLAALAAEGRLVTVARRRTLVLDLSTVPRPVGWAAYTSQPGTVAPEGAGTIELHASVPRPGRYGFWLGGSFRDRLDVIVDGKQIYSGRVGLTWAGVYAPVGQTTLGKGGHRVELRYHGPGLSPGSGGTQFSMGPLVLGRETAPARTESVTPADATSLCGRRLDWVEAVAP